MVLEPSERAGLRQFLVNRFNLEELKDLAFDLGADAELFPHDTKHKLSRELIAYFERRDKLNLLLTEILRKRPDNSLVQLLTKLPPPGEPPKKMQIIITEGTLEDVSEFLEELARKLNCARDEVVLISAVWGSMRLLVSLPEEIASSLAASQMHSLVDGKYQVVSISAFDSLDSISQKTWHFVSRDHPPVRRGNLVHPTISWGDALKVTRETLLTMPAPSEQLRIVPSFFVDRRQILNQYQNFLQRNSNKLYLVLDGVEGIGKTAVLHKLATQHSTEDRIIQLSLASPTLRNEPLTMLSRLASEFPDREFQAYATALADAYTSLQSAHIRSENNIVVEKDAFLHADRITQTAGDNYARVVDEVEETLQRLCVECHINMTVQGSLEAGEVVQIASVDLSKALDELKTQIRDELTLKFNHMVDSYLKTSSPVRLILLIDDGEHLQHSATGKLYADWFLTRVLEEIFRRFPTSLRVAFSATEAKSWLSTEPRLTLYQTLTPLTLADVSNYLQQRGIDNRRVAHTIFSLTQGHPLCMVLAADLYAMNPAAGTKALTDQATDPFDSGLLAYRLFIAIVEQMPDEAMKKLLRYAPTFRLLDDEVIENVLAVELGLAKDKLRALIERMKAYPFLEEQEEQVVFRPVIRQQVLRAMHESGANDPLYRALHRRAFLFYGQRWQRARGVAKSQLRVQMAYHEINLQPRQAQRQLQQLIEQAAASDDLQQVREVWELVRSGDVVELTPEEVWYLEQELPQEVRESVFTIEYGPDPPPGDGNSDERSKRIIAALANGIGYVYALNRRWIIGAYKYITSPLRRLEWHLWRTKQILRLQEKLRRELTEKRIPELQRIRQEALNLQGRIAREEVPRLAILQQANSELVQQVDMALHQVNSRGEISSIAYDIIDNRFNEQNRTVERYNREIQGFKESHHRFATNVKKAKQFAQELEGKLQTWRRKIEQHHREAQKLFQSGTALVFETEKEVRRAGELVQEIEAQYVRARQSEERMGGALTQFDATRAPVLEALNDLYGSIAHIQNGIEAANSMLNPLSGIELRSDDNRVMRINRR